MYGLLGLRYNTDEILGARSATKTFREFVIVSKLLRKNVLHYRRWTFYNANL